MKILSSETGSKRDRTRRAILDSAALLLAKDARAALGDIATAAGVGRTTVHRYFPTQQALLQGLALDAIERLSTTIADCRLADGPVPEVLQRVVDALVPMADELQFLDVGAAGWELPDLLERWYSLTAVLEGVIERGKQDGDLRQDLPTAWLADMIAAAVWAAGDAIKDGRLAHREAPRLVVEILLHGAGARPAR